METDAGLILACGALLAAGLFVWLVADRFRAPSLVLFLGLGMAIGSDGAGWIDFGFRSDDYRLTRLFGTVALAVILFEAGLASGLREIRPVLGPGIGLAVVDTLVTAGMAGFAAVSGGGSKWPESGANDGAGVGVSSPGAGSHRTGYEP